MVNQAYAHLGRGIFKELAISNKQRLKSSLEMRGTDVLEEMLKNNIPLEELGWTLAKAEIVDKENNARYLVNQK